MTVKNILASGIFILTIFAFPGVPAYADGYEQTFLRGNEAYMKGDYGNAVKNYESIIDRGTESANIYFNLGNAYFRSGEPEKAILNYERALRIHPGDAEILANYKFVKSSIGGPVLRRRGIWGWKPLKRYYDSFTVDDLFFISSGLYLTAIFMVAFGIFFRKFMFRMTVVTLLISGLLLCNTVIAAHKAMEIGKKAVVIAQDAKSRYGPFDSATVFFNLVRGAEVVILQEKDGWFKVKRPDGKEGWVKSGSLEII